MAVLCCSSSRCCRWTRRRKPPSCRNSSRSCGAAAKMRRSTAGCNEANRELRNTPVYARYVNGEVKRRAKPVNAAVNFRGPPRASSGKSPSCLRIEHCSHSTSPPACSPSPDRMDPASGPSLMNLLHDAIAAGKPWARERSLPILLTPTGSTATPAASSLLAKTKTAQIALADLFGATSRCGNMSPWCAATARGIHLSGRENRTASASKRPDADGHGQRQEGQNGIHVAGKIFAPVMLRACARQERAEQIAFTLSHADLPVVGDEIHGGKKLWLSRLKRDFHLNPAGRNARCFPAPCCTPRN